MVLVARKSSNNDLDRTFRPESLEVHKRRSRRLTVTKIAPTFTKMLVEQLPIAGVTV